MTVSSILEGLDFMSPNGNVPPIKKNNKWVKQKPVNVVESATQSLLTSPSTSSSSSEKAVPLSSKGISDFTVLSNISKESPGLIVTEVTSPPKANLQSSDSALPKGLTEQENTLVLNLEENLISLQQGFMGIRASAITIARSVNLLKGSIIHQDRFVLRYSTSFDTLKAKYDSLSKNPREVAKSVHEASQIITRITANLSEQLQGLNSSQMQKQTSFISHSKMLKQELEIHHNLINEIWADIVYRAKQAADQLNTLDSTINDNSAQDVRRLSVSSGGSKWGFLNLLWPSPVKTALHSQYTDSLLESVQKEGVTENKAKEKTSL